MKKVLIVDDEVEIVELIAMVLDNGKMELLSAYDGEQALEIVHESRPDLVLTDVMMPRLDGRELCKRIKSDPTTNGTVVVLMSAVNRIEAAECRADGIIRKPFDISQVSDTIDRLLATV
jgi:CheY-like chemotaxis protein